jgi:hypothetical protein
MVIYLVYQQFYADYENGEDDAVFIERAYKNKRKAVRKAKELVNKTKKDFYIDNDYKNIRNPFKNNNLVDFYKEKDQQENRTSSIVLEEIKLIA